jgi:hypothetical protein
MTSKTGIGQIALTRIGVSRRINNVDSDASQEAIAIRTIWEEARQYCLRDFPWPWATAYKALSLVDGSATTKANVDWQYSYRYPTDCMYARRIAIESVGRVNPSPPPFRIGRDSQGRLIYTNEPDATLEYTFDVTTPEEFDAIFVSMMAWKLASDIALPLSRIKDMSTKAMEMYEIDKSKAQSRALNEGQQEEPQEAEFIRARE